MAGSIGALPQHPACPMPQQRFRNARLRRGARRQRTSRRSLGPGEVSPHQRAIHRLALELKAREGLMAMFHTGVTWQAFQPLVAAGEHVHVHQEQGLRIGRRRYVPDLTVRRSETGPILFVVEVWHTHAVSERKRQAFSEARIPWIEVLSWHVLLRKRKQALPILDWGGDALPLSPSQGDLFSGEAVWSSSAANCQPVVSQFVVKVHSPDEAEMHGTQRATADSRVGAVSLRVCRPSSCM